MTAPNDLPQWAIGMEVTTDARAEPTTIVKITRSGQITTADGWRASARRRVVHTVQLRNLALKLSPPGTALPDGSTARSRHCRQRRRTWNERNMDSIVCANANSIACSIVDYELTSMPAW